MKSKEEEYNIADYDPLTRLRWLRDTFEDEIPDTIVHSNGGGNRYKVRRNWWYELTAALEYGLESKDIAEPEIRLQVQSFVKDRTSDEFKNRPLTTMEDIAKANQIINLVLGEK